MINLGFLTCSSINFSCKFCFFQINKRCRFLIEFEKQVKAALEDVSPKDHPFGGQDVTSGSLGWAMSAVSSRAFRLHGKALPDGKHNEVPMLLPLIDMCNHSFTPNASIVQERDATSPNMSVKVCILLKVSNLNSCHVDRARISRLRFLLSPTSFLNCCVGKGKI